MDFKEYWYKYWPKQNREYARRRWNEYQDVLKISTDYTIPKNDLTTEDFHKAEEALMKANVPMHTFCVQTDYHTSDFYNDCIQLAPLQAATACTSAPCKKQKGNNPMYVDNDKHIESSKINYLNDRLGSSFYKKEESLPAVFNLDTPKVPDTAEKLVEAITSGNYTVKPKDQRNIYDRVTSQIVWRSPSIVPDQAGFDAAREALSDLRQTAKDTIAVGTPADALLAIKAIDAFAPTTTAAVTA